MRLVLAAAILIAFPRVTLSQDFRSSILYTAPADTAKPASLAYVAPEAMEVPKQPSLILPMMGGAAGAVAGMYGGVIVGASIENEPADDITPGMVYGFLAGEMLLLPVGVHLGNGRKGNFLADLAVSAVIGTAAVLMTSATDDGTTLVIGAMAQYAAVIAVERKTARSRMERSWRQAQAENAGPPRPDSAQVANEPLPQPTRPENVMVPEQPSVAGPILVGLAAAVAGGYLGAAVFDDEDEGEDDYDAFAGFVTGEALMMPIGVHVGNGRHGSLLGDLAISMGGQLMAVALLPLGPVGYAAGLGGQVAFTVWNERAVGARSLRREAQAQAP